MFQARLPTSSLTAQELAEGRVHFSDYYTRFEILKQSKGFWAVRTDAMSLDIFVRERGDKGVKIAKRYHEYYPFVATY